MPEPLPPTPGPPPRDPEHRLRDVIVVGGGLAGLSAAIYLGRAMRDTLLIDSGHSMAVWEPDVQNYLGFPEGVSGDALLERGRKQVTHYGADCRRDDIVEARRIPDGFEVETPTSRYRAKRLLLATGITHVPPDIPEVKPCLGRSMFFCKDCDAYRVQGKRIAIFGHNDEAVEYALAMLHYSAAIMVVTNGHPPLWSDRHEAWLAEYEIPLFTGRIAHVEHDDGQLSALGFEGGRRLALDILFAVQGDLYHNRLARMLGAEVDAEGQVRVDLDGLTSVKGLYAAGCLTPANCQMIVAAGQGAIAGQAINRDLFDEELSLGTLRRIRCVQMQAEPTLPEVLE
ncbi:Thioredoxin reductase [compost metagenome]